MMFFYDRNNQTPTVLNSSRTCTMPLWFIQDTLLRTHCIFHITFLSWSTLLWVSKHQSKKSKSPKKIFWLLSHQQKKSQFKNRLQKLIKSLIWTARNKHNKLPSKPLNRQHKTLSKLLPHRLKNNQSPRNRTQKNYNCEVLCIFLDIFLIFI